MHGGGAGCVLEEERHDMKAFIIAKAPTAGLQKDEARGTRCVSVQNNYKWRSASLKALVS